MESMEVAVARKIISMDDIATGRRLERERQLGQSARLMKRNREAMIQACEAYARAMTWDALLREKFEKEDERCGS